MIFAQLLDSTGSVSVPLDMEYTTNIQTLTDEVLLERSLKNPDLFEFLVIRYQKQFLERAYFVVKSHDDAEDVVQDTFVRIYRFAPRFRGEEGTFKAWATTILMNVARTRYQKKAKDWARTAPLTPEHYEALPEEDTEEAELARDEVERLLNQIPKETAHIVKLALLDRVPYQEIAEREGITEGAVKTRVHRAKQLLRDTMRGR